MTAYGPPNWLRAILGFLLLIAVCVGLVLLSGQPGDPCMEFTGWRWEPTWPRAPHCQPMPDVDTSLQLALR